MIKVRPAAAVALVLLLAACSDAPVAPQLTPSFSRISSNEMLKLARYQNGPPAGPTYTSRTIGPHGGSIYLAGFEAIIPPGAISHPTTLSITLPRSDGKPNFVWATFGPHGTRFNVPVTLRVPYAGTTSVQNPGALVMWFDGAQWIALAPTTRTADGRLETQVKHFSDYGTETPDTLGRGIVVAGN